MQNYKDNQLVNDGNAVFDFSIISVIGDRTEQQDSFGYSLKNNEGIIVLCDGMGGHEGGRAASNIAVNCFISDYETEYPSSNTDKLLIDCVTKCDKKIASLTDPDGKLLRAGSTAVALIIKEKELYWCSVGDSRAYLLRNSEFVQLTQDQNYRTVLNEKLKAGVIRESEYYEELKRGEALISYLGIGNLSLIDYNSSPLKLESKDKLIIMSDGLYKLVPDEEMQRVIENFKNKSDALQALDMKAKKAAKGNRISRDNMTIAIVEMK